MNGQVMEKSELEAVRAEAMERRGLRRNRIETRTVEEERKAWVEGRTLPSIYGGPDLRPAQTLGEGLDDIVLRYGGVPNRFDPAIGLVAAIAAAAIARGAAAAVKSVRAARELGRPVQYALFRNLRELETDPDAVRTGAARVMTRCLAEWKRLGLAETQEEVPGGRRVY